MYKKFLWSHSTDYSEYIIWNIKSDLSYSFKMTKTDLETLERKQKMAKLISLFSTNENLSSTDKEID